jgi:hypothetical protein
MLVWGHKYQLEPKCEVETDCPQCGRSPMILNHGRKKFTLYWIPTFTMSEGYFLKCPRCNNDTLYGPIEAKAAEELMKARAR